MTDTQDDDLPPTNEMISATLEEKEAASLDTITMNNNTAAQDEKRGDAGVHAVTWLECEDDQGNVYYYNQETGESTWVLPEGEVIDAVPFTLMPQETRSRLQIELSAPADSGPGSPSATTASKGINQLDEKETGSREDALSQNSQLSTNPIMNGDPQEKTSFSADVSETNSVAAINEKSNKEYHKELAEQLYAAQLEFETKLTNIEAEHQIQLDQLRGERNEIMMKQQESNKALQGAKQTVKALQDELQSSKQRDAAIIQGLREELQASREANDRNKERARLSAENFASAQQNLENLQLESASNQKQALEARNSIESELVLVRAHSQTKIKDLSDTNEDQTQQIKRLEMLLRIAKEEVNQESCRAEKLAREEQICQCSRATSQAVGSLQAQLKTIEDPNMHQALENIIKLLVQHHDQEDKNSSRLQPLMLSTHQAQLDALASTIHELQERLQVSQAQLAKLENEKSSQEQLKTRFSQLEAQIARSALDKEEAVSSSQKRAEQLQNELNSAIDEIEAYKVSEAKLEAQLVKLQSRVKDLEAGFIQVPQYDPTLTKELTEARSGWKETSEELDRVKEELAQRTVRLEEVLASETKNTLALQNALENLAEASAKADAAIADAERAQNQEQELQEAVEEALNEATQASADAAQMQEMLEMERRKHFQERGALLSELDLHKCAAKSRTAKAQKRLKTGLTKLQHVHGSLKDTSVAWATMRKEMKQELSSFSNLLQQTKRDLAERTLAVPLCPETLEDDIRDTGALRFGMNRASIDTLAFSPDESLHSSNNEDDGGFRDVGEVNKKRRVATYCRIHPRICHILNSSVIMANRDALELCNPHGKTRRWALSGLVDSYVKNQQTFDALHLSAFCFAADPDSAYCAIFHGHHNAVPRLSVLGDNSDPGLLAQAVFACVQQLGYSNYDMALEVCQVNTLTSRLIFRTEGITCKSLRVAQALVNSLPINPVSGQESEPLGSDERPLSGKKQSSRKKLRRPKRLRRPKSSKGVAPSVLPYERESNFYIENNILDDEQFREDAESGVKGNPSFPQDSHEVFTLLVNDHPRIQFVVLNDAIGAPPSKMDLYWKSEERRAFAEKLPATDSILEHVLCATRAWQRGNAFTAKHPLLNQLYYLHTSQATLHIVTHITQALKDADQSLLHLESASSFVRRSR